MRLFPIARALNEFRSRIPDLLKSVVGRSFLPGMRTVLPMSETTLGSGSNELYVHPLYPLDARGALDGRRNGRWILREDGVLHPPCNNQSSVGRSSARSLRHMVD